MITEILTPGEFARSGLNLLNLAWSIGIEIEGAFDDADVDSWDSDGEVRDEYWRESQPALGNALALVQQAQEMALKGMIAAVSPYLLIGRDAREWPRGCEREDKPFSMFRTVDAADLIKIYNTVCPSPLRLGEDFEAFFDDVRRQRNAIIHIGGTGQPVEVAELFLNVLLTAEHLYPGARWTERRLTHLENDRIAVMHTSKHVGYFLLKEFETVARLLKPAEARRFFGLTKARRYLCPLCHEEAVRYVGEYIPLAQLVPNAPSATAVSCFVCGTNTTVSRRACAEDDCKSNVICADPQWRPICLVCGTDQDQSGRGRLQALPEMKLLR